MILGIRMKQNGKESLLNQCHYIEKVLTKLVVRDVEN